MSEEAEGAGSACVPVRLSAFHSRVKVYCIKKAAPKPSDPKQDLADG